MLVIWGQEGSGVRRGLGKGISVYRGCARGCVRWGVVDVGRWKGGFGMDTELRWRRC